MFRVAFHCITMNRGIQYLIFCISILSTPFDFAIAAGTGYTRIVRGTFFVHRYSVANQRCFIASPFLLVPQRMYILIILATPTFKLLASRSGVVDPETNIPEMEVTFEDGQKDTLVLKHYNALPDSNNIDPSRLCNYLGHLENEKTARVAVTGCVDDKNLEKKMYISMISARSPYQKLFSMDFDGNVTPIQLGESNDAYETSQGVVVSRAGKEFQQLDEIGETDIEAAAEASTTDGVPHNLKMKVKIGTDTASINKIVNGLGRTVDDWLAETFTHVQNHYHHATLQHKIDFEAGIFNCYI